MKTKSTNGVGTGNNHPARGGRMPIDAVKALKEARIRHLMLLIASGRYVSGLTAEALSKPPTDPETPGWGLSIKHVEKLAGEAAGRLRERFYADDIVRTATLSTLEFIRATALDKGDLKAAIQACLAIHGIVTRGFGLTPQDAQQPMQPVINISNILPWDRIRAAEANASAVAQPQPAAEPEKAAG